MMISGSKVKIIMAWDSPIHWIIGLGITDVSGIKYRVLNLVLHVLMVTCIFLCFCVCVSKCTALQSFNKINTPRSSQIFC